MNIGTGTSIIHLPVESPPRRLTGTAIGGGTFEGLANLILGRTYGDADRFVEYLNIGLGGKLDMMSMVVKDIFGGNSPYKGLDESIVASSFSKVRVGQEYRDADIVRNLAFMVSVSVAQVGVISAMANNIPTIVFTGNYSIKHEVVLDTL